MADCQILNEQCQKIGSRLDYAFNWTDALARKWGADEQFDAGVRVRPLARPPNGLEWVSSGGQSNGRAEPKWPFPAEVDDTIPDGSLIWTGALLTNGSLIAQIQSSVWTPPAGMGLTVDGATIVNTPGMQRTAAFVLGVTAGTFDIPNVVTLTNGAIMIGVLRLTIEA